MDSNAEQNDVSTCPRRAGVAPRLMLLGSPATAGGLAATPTGVGSITAEGAGTPLDKMTANTENNYGPCFMMPTGPGIPAGAS